MKDVQGKVAFITGGASGMGLGMARAFSAAGMKVMIGDIEEEPMNRAVAEINDAGGDAAGVKVDVTQLESVSEAGIATTEKFGKVHVICNNAGIGVGGKCETASMPNWKWVTDVNMWGVLPWRRRPCG
ncbi:MAG: SDR family NAD(P)-dependent oxidoreductase [Pseudomonadales bacterium]|nr:SDR family NAD(P)-dependent oxidoreductase [Pseudomonadales bacterium]